MQTHQAPPDGEASEDGTGTKDTEEEEEEEGQEETAGSSWKSLTPPKMSGNPPQRPAAGSPSVCQTARCLLGLRSAMSLRHTGSSNKLKFG